MHLPKKSAISARPSGCIPSAKSAFSGWPASAAGEESRSAESAPIGGGWRPRKRGSRRHLRSSGIRSAENAAWRCKSWREWRLARSALKAATTATYSSGSNGPTCQWESVCRLTATLQNLFLPAPSAAAGAIRTICGASARNTLKETIGLNMVLATENYLRGIVRINRVIKNQYRYLASFSCVLPAAIDFLSR